MNDCRGELLQRMRRGLASEQEQLALEAHVGGCASCRLTAEVTADFDRVGGAVPGDAERIGRIAARARQLSAATRRSPPGPRRSTVAVRLLLAALAVGGAAAAAAVTWVQSRPAPPSAVAPDLEPSSPAAVPRSAPQRRLLPSAAASSLPAFAPVASAPRPAASAPSEPPASASALFRLANEARREGHSALAIARYEELERTFPGSAEGTLAHVSLGGLLLAGGSPAAALAQFDGYLARAGKQPLAAEALYGRARALAVLGRRAEATQAWRRLAASYPDSPYRSEAERHLEERR